MDELGAAPFVTVLLVLRFLFGAFQGGTAADVGRKLFTTYLLPFEVTSILILIAIVGAIVLARKEI